MSRVPLPGGRFAWLVTRYEDCAAALADPRLVKDRRNVVSNALPAAEPWVPGFVKPLMRNMLDLDEPDHGRLRALVGKAFTPRRALDMADRIQALADQLLTQVRGRSSWDLLNCYAVPIPTIVISEILGIPAADRHRFHRWTQRIVSGGHSTWGMIRAVPSLWRFLRYIRRQVQSRRAEPRDDLLTALVQVEEAGERMDDDELVAMVFLLLVAGHETTVNLIGNGVLALLQHPDQLRWLRDDPPRIKSAVEELLRFAGPLETATERYCRDDLEFAGTHIPGGSLVLAALASANRDEGQFDRPDELDLGREPNKHLAFGLGPHYCLGAPLARLEAQIAFSTLLRRCDDLGLAVAAEQLRWRGGLVVRGLKGLPVRARIV